MQASQSDQKLFYTLVNRQRKTTSATPPFLIVDGQILQTENDITEGWKSHFNNLATPQTRSHFDEKFYNLVEEEGHLIKIITERDSHSTPLQISTKHVLEASRASNSNKAADCQGITAEHIKYGGPTLIKVLTSIVNAVLATGEVPQQLKTGIISPVLKKNKDNTIPGNYRGITVTSTFGKLLECIILKIITPRIESYQNPMQRGFTKSVSPVNAALMVEECINEAKDNKQTIALATLDAEKAFDVVWHNGLLRKLFHLDIPASAWNMIQFLQTKAVSRVKWMDTISNNFEINQGIRQGAKLSPTSYKVYVNQVLDILSNSGIGAHIGNIYVGAPTVADDIAILADCPADLQTALHVVFNNSAKDRSTLNVSKSDVVIYNAPSSRTPSSWQLGSQIGSTVVKAFAFQADGLGFNSPSGYKVGRPGHFKYVWVGQYEPSCLKFPSSVLEHKL